MKQVMTVLGPIDPSELGLTSMHEHIMCDGSAARLGFEDRLPRDLPVRVDDKVSLENVGLLRRNFILTWDGLRIDDETTVTQEVMDFKASGGRTILEMSVPGLRLDVPAIQRISRASGVHVVATTGLYVESSWPPRYRCMSIDQYVDHMLREVDQGIDASGIKAGHLKAAVSTLTEQEEKMLRAVARVALATGLSVTIHPGIFSVIGADGRRIVKILREEGVDLSRVIIAHTQVFFFEHSIKTLIQDPGAWGLRLDYAKELLDAGVNLSVDCFGESYDAEFRDWTYGTDWQRLAGLVALVRAGYSRQIVLGTDTWLKIQLRRYGGDGYCRLTKYVLPTLQEIGVSDYDSRQMMVENPARLLARECGPAA